MVLVVLTLYWDCNLVSPIAVECLYLGIRNAQERLECQQSLLQADGKPCWQLHRRPGNAAAQSPASPCRDCVPKETALRCTGCGRPVAIPGDAVEPLMLVRFQRPGLY